MKTKDTGSEIDEILGNYGIVRISKKPPFGIVHIESDTLFEDLEALIDKREVESQKNGVAWAIKEIDYWHGLSDSLSEDRLYKGIKNKIRDSYLLEAGEDPAPSYPITAELKALSAKHSSKEQ